MNHLAIARASCEGREGTHPALRPNGSGLRIRHAGHDDL